MKLSISNIAWDAENDLEMYSYISSHGFSGLEIAPTRLFSENPYEKLTEAQQFAEALMSNYSLVIPSMQSIWYGRSESMFGTKTEQQTLINYTQQAVLFAEALNCRNLVFGCPRNRNIPEHGNAATAIDFFCEIGDFAAEHGRVIALEPNPPIYNTNFINTTAEAFELCRKINHPGIKVNIDLGTMIYYKEDLESIGKNISMVNHIHISEPMLAVIEKREIHRELQKLEYEHWVSIEMKNLHNIDAVKSVIHYVSGLNHDL